MPVTTLRRSMEPLILAAIVIACAIAALWSLQGRLVFFPQPIDTTSHLPPFAGAIEVTAADGTRLRGWFRSGASAPAPLVVYFGGNAEEVSWTLADPRWPRDWAVAAVNYRGYGASEGTPGERAILSDALAVHDVLARRTDVDSHRVVAFGRSLGSAVAVHVAASRPVAGVVLVSPFDSLVNVGRGHYPWLPVATLLRHRFAADQDARRARSPMLAVVGTDDAIVTPARSRALFDAWAGPKTWQSVEGADHASVGDRDACWEAVARFLAQR